MSILVALLLKAALLVGYSGVIFHASYDDNVQTASSVLSTYNTCLIKFNTGFSYIEKSTSVETVPDYEWLVGIAIHEFLHCQGVDHSTDCTSIMYPVYLYCPLHTATIPYLTDTEYLQLHNDRIQRLTYRSVVVMVVTDVVTEAETDVVTEADR